MNKLNTPKVSLKKRIEILKKVSIFDQTEESLLQEVAKAMTEVMLSTEETIFEKGDEGSEMYVIMGGAVKIHDGDYVFAVLRDGQVFGEYSLLGEDNKARTASVTAVTNTHLLMLEQDVFYKLLSDKINIIKGILSVLIKRSKRQNFYEEKLAESNERIQKQQKLLKEEKEKSDELLLNILPDEVADELKAKGKADVRSYAHASVLFADVKGFTQASQVLSPEEVVQKLEIYFTRFDEISLQHDIEKIKTIGDAYMCAGGIPVENESNPIDLTLTALQMQNFMNEQKDKDATTWQLRVGINTGPLIAGVIGKTKFAYDIWGDTVNTASRMESSGVVGKVNISINTYQYVKDYFECEYRGQVDAKGKGKVDMYFVNRLKPEFSEDEGGLVANTTMKQIIREMNQ